MDARKQAPGLQLTDLDDQTVDLADFRDRIVVVNFWATWCPPCRREMGSLQRLYGALKTKGVEVLAVNIGEDFDTVFSFMGTVEPTPEFKTLLDRKADTMTSWAVKGLPTTYVVDTEGKLVKNGDPPALLGRHP
jgi:thiol-disulfide isomerase/thioredoxin